MLLLAQLFDVKKAQRSEPFQTDRKDLGTYLKASCEKHELPLEDCAIIVLMQKENEDDDWQFTKAPLYRGDDFIKYFGENHNGA